MDPIAAKYIGAGIACIGMGGAASAWAHLRPLSRRRAAQSVGRTGPVRQPDFRLRRDRSARHLLAADRAPAAVRALSIAATGNRSCEDDAVSPGYGANSLRSRWPRTHIPNASGPKGPFPPFQKETFASQLVLARDHLRCALSADLAHRVAAHRRHHRGRGRAHRGRPCRGAALEGRVGSRALRPTRRRSRRRANARRRSQTKPATSSWPKRKPNARRSKRTNTQLAEAEKRSPAPNRPPWRTCAASRSMPPRPSSSG